MPTRCLQRRRCALAARHADPVTVPSALHLASARGACGEGAGHRRRGMRRRFAVEATEAEQGVEESRGTCQRSDKGRTLSGPGTAALPRATDPGSGRVRKGMGQSGQGSQPWSEDCATQQGCRRSCTAAHAAASGADRGPMHTAVAQELRVVVIAERTAI